MVGVVWLTIGIIVARSAAVRSRRWRRDLAAAGTVQRGRGRALPTYVERRFPWHTVDVVTVRRVGLRRARTVLVAAAPDSELFATPATADRFRPQLQAFAVCDLSASAMPATEVTTALRRHGGDRWRDQ